MAKEATETSIGINLQEFVVELLNASQSHIVLHQTYNVTNLSQVDDVDHFNEDDSRKLKKCKHKCAFRINKIIEMKGRVLHHELGSLHLVAKLKVNQACANKTSNLHFPTDKVKDRINIQIVNLQER